MCSVQPAGSPGMSSEPSGTAIPPQHSDNLIEGSSTASVATVAGVPSGDPSSSSTADVGNRAVADSSVGVRNAASRPSVTSDGIGGDGGVSVASASLGGAVSALSVAAAVAAQEEFQSAWCNYMRQDKMYVRLLGTHALKTAEANPKAPNPAAAPPHLLCPAVGGMPPMKVCALYLQGKCSRATRCPDGHPVAAQFRRSIRDCKRKRCPVGDQCCSQQCLSYHPRDGDTFGARGEDGVAMLPPQLHPLQFRTGRPCGPPRGPFPGGRPCGFGGGLYGGIGGPGGVGIGGVGGDGGVGGMGIGGMGVGGMGVGVMGEPSHWPPPPPPPVWPVPPPPRPQLVGDSPMVHAETTPAAVSTAPVAPTIMTSSATSPLPASESSPLGRDSVGTVNEASLCASLSQRLPDHAQETPLSSDVSSKGADVVSRLPVTADDPPATSAPTEAAVEGDGAAASAYKSVTAGSATA